MKARNSQHPPGGRLQLLDLPDSLLVAVAQQLPALQDLLRLEQACRRWRGVCAGPSPLWRVVSITIPKSKLRGMPKEQRNKEANRLLRDVGCWLAPRLAAVQELSITLCSADPLLVGDAPVSATTTLPQGLFGVHGPPLSMRKLTLSWPGQVRLVFPTGGRLSSLRHLSLQNCKSVHLLLAGPCAAPPGLEAFAVVDVEHFELAAPPGAHAAPPGSQSQQWLPPSLTMLRLSDAGLRELPHVLALLPRLRSLDLATNRLSNASLAPLEALTPTLQELNLSESYLRCFPSQLSALTGLRVLYLHDCFHRTAAVAPGDWRALEPLRRLAFLSISGLSLAALPPPVVGMTQLLGLHIEGNELAEGLPAGPYLSGLRELLLDWQAALDGAAALRGAAALTRLVLSGHRCVDLQPQQRLTVRPAAAAEPLLAALAALAGGGGRLRAVEDVLLGGEDTVTAPVAHCMWQLGSRCPRLRVGLLQDANVGMSLAEVERAEVPAGGMAGGA